MRTIEKIADALGVPVYWLFDIGENKDGADGNGVVVRSGEGAELTVLAEGIKKTLVTPPSFADMQLMRVEMEPGSKSSDGFYQHKGIDVGYVLSGSLNLDVNGKLYVLAAGDCFAFDSHLPHRFENRGGVRQKFCG